MAKRRSPNEQRVSDYDCVLTDTEQRSFMGAERETFCNLGHNVEKAEDLVANPTSVTADYKMDESTARERGLMPTRSGKFKIQGGDGVFDAYRPATGGTTADNLRRWADRASANSYGSARRKGND